MELIRTEGLIAGELDVLFRRHGLTGPGFNVLMLPPWQPRSVMVQGEGEAIPPGEAGEEALIRITSVSIVSWGLGS